MGFLENLIGGNNKEKDEELEQESDDEASDEDKNSETEETSTPNNDIEMLRKEVVDTYLTKLNKKDFVKGLLRGKNMKAEAREYILKPKEEEGEAIDLSGLNLPPEAQQFVTALKGGGSSFLPSIFKKFTGVSIGFDEEKELNPMKELMARTEYQNDAQQLKTLKQSIEDGVDITTLLAAPVVVGTGVVVANAASESSNVLNLKAEGVGACFSILTGSTDAGIHNINAQNTIEAMNTSCTFFGKDLTVNKYMVPKLQEVEKEIKDSDIDYPIESVGGYNWRNVSGGNSLSYHALGLALDINPAKNPFAMTSGGDIVTDMPKEFIEIFKKHGFVRGGNRGQEGRTDSYKADAMHFQFQDENYLKEQMQLDAPALAA